MIKLYCDRCGKDITEEEHISITIEYIGNGEPSETCTAKSLQAFDICWGALTCIDHIIKHSEQIVCLNSDEIKKIREVLNTVDTKLHKLKVV